MRVVQDLDARSAWKSALGYMQVYELRVKSCPLCVGSADDAVMRVSLATKILSTPINNV